MKSPSIHWRIFFAHTITSFVIIVTWSYVLMTIADDRREIALYVGEVVERVLFPLKIARLRSVPPDEELLVPLQGIRPEDIADTWGEPRSGGRTHEGVDIFAERGTPIFSATKGYVVRVGRGNLGGNLVFVIGPGGRRYYYAHMDRIAEGMKRGEEVTADTVLGFVGSTGNAEETPPHLHFGMYTAHGAENPYPLLVERSL